MEKKKLRILMLGWEFPPFLTGGLGKASYGLAKALSQYTDLTLVVPKSDQTYFNENWRVIGLNELDSSDNTILPPNQDRPEIRYVDANLDPYAVENLFKKYPTQALEAFFRALIPSATPKPLSSVSVHPLPKHENRPEPPSFLLPEEPEKTLSGNLPTEAEEFMREAIPMEFTPEQTSALYSDPELYGSNLLTKIAAYTETVRQISTEVTFDVIHAHDWMTFPAALQIKEETNIPVVLHIHSLETDRQGTETAVPQENIAYRIEQAAIEQADAVIAVSEYTQGQLEEYYDVAPEIVTPIHNAIEPLADQSLPKDSPAEDFYLNQGKGIRQKLVVWVGRVTYQKGPAFLLDTAERLTKIDSQTKFVVAGTGDLLPWMIEESAKRRLSDKILFTGFLNQEKVNALLSQADVFFMPSASEPFGLAALEAAQLGIPCVISSQSGVAEVLPSALKADYWDTKKLANYLYALLHYEGLRKELIAQSQADLASVTWEKSAREVLDVYEKILK